MKNLLLFLVMNLVSHPDDVKVEKETSDQGDNYYITVHPEDIGKIIGKRGSVIQAIRTLAKVRAIKEQRRIFIQLANED